MSWGGISGSTLSGMIISSRFTQYKNASLPIVAANFLLDNPVNITNKPDILDLQVLEEIFAEAKEKSTDFFDLTMEKATKIRTSILLIPYWLCKYWKVKFVWSGGCNIWKRPLDTFDEWLTKAWIKITNDDYKTYEIVWQPKKNIMMPEFSVTAIEALLTYLAFANNFDYEINIYQVAIEPHVRDLIKFLNNIWADITLNVDHTIVVKPSKIQVKDPNFTVTSDFDLASTMVLGTHNFEVSYTEDDVTKTADIFKTNNFSIQRKECSSTLFLFIILLICKKIYFIFIHIFASILLIV